MAKTTKKTKEEEEPKKAATVAKPKDRGDMTSTEKLAFDAKMYPKKTQTR